MKDNVRAMFRRPWFVQDGPAHWMPNAKGLLAIVVFAMVASATMALIVAAGAWLGGDIAHPSGVVIALSVAVSLVAVAIELAGFLFVVVWSARQPNG